MKFAWKNIMARKMTSVKVMITLIFMIIIMCVFTAYSIALSDETEKVVKSYKAGHYLSYESSIRLTPIMREKLNQIDGIDYTLEKGYLDNRAGLRGMAFYLDGVEYACKDFIYDDPTIDTGDYYQNYLHKARLNFVDSKKDIISSNEKEEYKYRFLEDNPLIYGRSYLENENEMILSIYVLDDIGLSVNDVLNKKIDFKYNGKVYDDIKVVGVTGYEYVRLTTNENEFFYLSYDSDIVKDNKSNVKNTVEIYISNYMQAQLVANDLVKNGFIGLSAGSEYGMYMATTVTIVGNILAGVMGTVGVGIIGALTLNIILSMRYMIIKKVNFYGIISAYGLKNYSIFNMLFFEMAYIALFAAVIAYAISYGFLYLLDFIMSSLVGIGVIFSWANFLITLAVAVVFTLTVILAVTIVNFVAFTRRYSAKLLNKSIDN